MEQYRNDNLIKLIIQCQDSPKIKGTQNRKPKSQHLSKAQEFM